MPELLPNPPTLPDRPAYFQVFLTFARNSLVRDMTYRANFIIECVTSLSWVLMNVGFYVLVFEYTPSIGLHEQGWTKYQFFVFMATTVIINSLVQAFFMPNADDFGELIRSGELDFALLKPIDTQFLISLRRVEWSSLANLAFALFLLGYSLWRLARGPDAVVVGPAQWLLYPLYVACGVAILYSLMIALAAAGVWLGR